MSDKVYRNVINRWKDVVDLPPQELGLLTPYYKRTVKRLKAAPWQYLFLSGVIFGMGLYAVFGPSISSIASILQRGF